MVSIAIIGGEGSGRSALAARLGKKGNVSDITMYDFAKGSQILTIIDSSGYPASPKPLMTALGMCELVLLLVPPSGMDSHTGECVIAIDLMELNNGVIVQTMSDRSNPFELEKNAGNIRTLLKGTTAQNWEIIPISTVTFDGIEQLKGSINALEQDIAKRNQALAQKPPRVIVDHSFNVRGIGSVVLGRVTRGTINKHQKLTIHPIKREIEIRNIQMHDIDRTSAGPGSRVGLALKGVQAKEVNRGHIISEHETLSSEIELDCRVSRFSPGLRVDSTLHIYVSLQSAPVKISRITVNGHNVDEAPAGSTCRVSLDCGEMLAFDNNDIFVLSDLNNLKQRFIASGHVVEAA